MCAGAATTPAAAQTACDGRATFHTFEPSSGEYDPGVGTHFALTDNINLNGSLVEIFARLGDSPETIYRAVFIEPLPGNERQFDSSGFVAGEPPRFSGMTLSAGSTLRLVQPNVAGGGNRLTTRVYIRSDGMPALTPVDDNGNPIDADGNAIADTCADGLTGDQFFLDEDWAETKTADANNQGANLLVAADCPGANRVVDSDMLACACEAGYSPDASDAAMCVPTSDAACVERNGVAGQIWNMENSACECPSGETVNAAGDMCVAIPSCDAATTTYNSGTNMCDCNAENPRRVSATMCEPTPSDPTPPNCTGNNRINDDGDGCVPCGENMRPTSDRMMCVADTPTPAPTPQPAPAPSPQTVEDADWATAGGLVGGLVGFIVALHYLDGGAEDFSFSPDFGYSISESGYSYKYGGRLDLIKDNWSLYMSAGQRNADGEFGDLRYESGGEYDGGFWRASFSERLYGETTDYDFSLSADWNGGIWKLSPTYRFRSQLTKGGLESESGNALNLEGVLRYHRWTLRPSAGFRWRRADDFGGDAKFAITAVRRF